MTRPEITWLQQHWHLPTQAIEHVTKLLDAQEQGNTALAITPPHDWGNAASSPSPAAPTPATPLILVPYNGGLFLQSRRDWCNEHTVARWLHLAALSTCHDLGEAQATRALRDAQLAPSQHTAALVALRHQLAIISGGPGTGKTYTLARILAALLELGCPAKGIRLAAPTGKAAARMKEAISHAAVQLPTTLARHAPALVDVANSCSTLHQLLGYQSEDGSCRYHQQEQLPAQVLIVDECSMIDLFVWRALVDALPNSTRLILLGDPEQLESVSLGSVFSELVSAATSPSSPFHPVRAHLTESRRFGSSPRILALAQALENRDGACAASILNAARETIPSQGLTWWGALPTTAISWDSLPAPIQAALERVADAPTAPLALQALEEVCILTAQRDYFVGSVALSLKLQEHLAARPTTRNEPIIIQRNDPETGLRNGSVGVLHRDPSGERKAYFLDTNGALKSFSIGQLPDYESAWVITIHRSQGSEYAEVLVLLPHHESPLNTRKLLYTAITRAKRHVHILGDLATVQRAVANEGKRLSLLPYHWQ